MARDLLDRMQAIVSKILSDEDLLSGASITNAGFQKLAGQLGISADETRMLFNSLITRLRKDQDRIVEAQRMFEDEPEEGSLNVAPGAIVCMKRGGIFDEVTHYFVRTVSGYLQINTDGGEKGVPRFSVISKELPETTVSSSYDQKFVVVPAPAPGEIIANNVQIVGLADGTKILSPSKKIMLKKGLGVETDGQHFDFRFVADKAMGIDACRLFKGVQTESVDARFTVEPDALGNATVRDGQSGKSIFLRGKDAADAVRAAKGGVNAQALLARFEPLMEDEADHWAAKRETGFYGAQGAGALFLARDTGRILLGERSTKAPPYHVEQPGTWNGIGGAIDRGEDPSAAVRREAQEELGYRGEIDLVPLFVFQSGSFRYSNFLAIVDREFDPRLNWEHESAEWCEWGDWPAPLHFGFKAILNDPKSVQTIEAAIANATPAGNLQESAEILTEESFDDEISTSAGTYNFPWSIGGQHGLATARYSGRGPNMQIKVLSVRDDQGQKIADADAAFMSLVEQQAMDIIGEE